MSHHNINDLRYNPNNKIDYNVKLTRKNDPYGFHQHKRDLDTTPIDNKDNITLKGTLKGLDKMYITKELCDLAVSKNAYDLEYVPEEFITKEMCKIAFSNNGYSLEHIPLRFRTYNMYLLAVSKSGFLLNDVPLEYITNEINNAYIEYVKNKKLDLIAIMQD